MNLKQIQQELKAPKSRRNSFGNYNYRSCEDILEAVKPMLQDSTLVLTDEIVNVGDHNYIKATAIFNDGEVTLTTAFARESETKKGMDDSQITGTASSYARKYALNGLFLIDDTKDADTDEFHKTAKKQAEKATAFEEEDNLNEVISDTMSNRLTAIIKLNKTAEQATLLGRDLCKEFKVKKVSELTNGQFPQAVKWLEGK